MSYESISKKVKTVFGFLSEAHSKKLYELARSLPPKSVIAEIGSLAGKSTIALASAVKEKQGIVYAIDIFKSGLAHFREILPEDYFPVFQANMKKNNLDNVIPLRGRSEEIGKTWKIPIDMLFIDGGHTYPQVKLDFGSFFPHVKKGGIVCFHDACPSFKGVWKLFLEKKDLLNDLKQVENSLRYGIKK